MAGVLLTESFQAGTAAQAKHTPVVVQLRFEGRISARSMQPSAEHAISTLTHNAHIEASSSFCEVFAKGGMKGLTTRRRTFGYTFLCMIIVFTPLLAIAFAAFSVGTIAGNEAEFMAAFVTALPLAFAIALILGVLGGCCAVSGNCTGPCM